MQRYRTVRVDVGVVCGCTVWAVGAYRISRVTTTLGGLALVVVVAVPCRAFRQFFILSLLLYCVLLLRIITVFCVLYIAFEYNYSGGIITKYPSFYPKFTNFANLLHLCYTPL